MPAAPLDALYARRQILADDRLAGRRYGYLAAHRNSHEGCRRRFAEARDALDRVGTLSLQMVEMIVLVGVIPRSERGLTAATDGFEALDRHFRATWPEAWLRQTM